MKIHVIPTEFRKPGSHFSPGFTPGPTNMASRKRDFCLQFLILSHKILSKLELLKLEIIGNAPKMIQFPYLSVIIRSIRVNCVTFHIELVFVHKVLRVPS